ncbi:MAG TPA: cupin domain-containing protein [Acidimicrobiales bacterium]|nr:cupin domain-containing protein [Acidimicrobiales bacterium]
MIDEGLETQGIVEDPTAQRFTLKDAPTLSAGRFDSVLAKTEGFAARVKVYAEGGENASHTHLREDHLFLILAGQATFHLGRDGEEEIVANPYDGVFLPRGAFYRFLSSGDENLVMFRVGGFDSEDRMRVGPDGSPLHGHSKKNNHVDGVVVAGRHFEN